MNEYNIINRAKTHVKNNKKVYIAAGAGVVVGIVGTWVFAKSYDVTQKAQNIALVNWKPVSNLEQTVILTRRGHPGFVVLCNETGETFASIRRTAEAMDLNRVNLTQHLQGKIPDVDGLTFQKLGEAV